MKMGYRNPYGSQLYQQATLLSQKVAEEDEFFKHIALMGIEERRKYAMLYVITTEGLLEMDLSSMNETELIEKIIMPMLQRIGQAKFKADPLTHLGMKLGRPSESQRYERDTE